MAVVTQSKLCLGDILTCFHMKGSLSQNETIQKPPPRKEEGKGTPKGVGRCLSEVPLLPIEESLAAWSLIYSPRAYLFYLVYG